MRSVRIIHFLSFVLAAGLLAAALPGATFGDIVPIVGQAADIALDEPRGVLYIANFTAGRIDVLSLETREMRTSLHVAPGPSSLALSPGGRYLVATHLGSGHAITVIDLDAQARQTFALGSPPLGVAFGNDGMALVGTSTEFLRLDPATGRTTLVDTVSGVVASSLPAAPGTLPAEIVSATLAASADGRFIFGVTDTARFVYDVSLKNLRVTGYTSTPRLGPRVVSVSRDGSYFAAGWAVFNRRGTLLSQFANASGDLAVGSHALDSMAGILYAQIPAAVKDEAKRPAPVLSVVDSDNLTVRESLWLPENLAGRGLLNAGGDTMYAVSESGVAILPVGSLRQQPRLVADREDLVFHGNFCQRGGSTQTFTLADPGGGRTAFAITSDLAGVTITPASGRTPATIQVRIDPASFQDRRGTVVGWLTIQSGEAINIPRGLRLLVNNQRPDERGVSTSVPGTLTDILADPVRDRFYIVRQDRNQVLVFDGSGFFPLASLRTANTPTRLAITPDGKYLLVGHENAQLVSVYDLDTLQPMPPVAMPGGHYPRSVAASGNAILAASRVAGNTHTIERLDLNAGSAVTLPTLGVFENSVAADTALAATPDGTKIMAVSADGGLLLYDATSDAFVVSRKLAADAVGAFAAGNGWFFAANSLLNTALVPVQTFAGAEGTSAFAFVEDQGIQYKSSSSAGSTLSRIDLGARAVLRPTRIAEQPPAPGGYSVFLRGLAPLSNRTALVALTVSGFTAVAWSFDAAVVPPSVREVVNAADFTASLAPGSVIAVTGANFSPTNLATQSIPLPTALGESCLTVNGTAIPMFFVSPNRINAQLPLHLEGIATLTIYTPGGVSDDYYLKLQKSAPAVFHTGTAGPLINLPVVIKNSNQQLITASNPIHSGDEISVYATGLGATLPEVEAGQPGPSSPLARTIQIPEVRLGDVSLAVSYAGLAPGQVGVFQINARAPARPPLGTDVPLTVVQGGAAVSVSVRVVE